MRLPPNARADGGTRRGNMGHLTRIANMVVQNLEKGPVQAQITDLIKGEHVCVTATHTHTHTSSAESVSGSDVVVMVCMTSAGGSVIALQRCFPLRCRLVLAVLWHFATATSALPALY